VNSARDRYYLAAALAVQAALLFWRLDLLPVWGDEQFTLDTSQQPLSKIVEIVRGDIHPPLYYFLVHYWIGLGWPASLVVKARAFSGLWALATTILFYRWWLEGESRGRFLFLWTLSPCLILYGRMARSYTLQLFLAALTLYWGMRLLREPRKWLIIVSYAISGALLFYTHYLSALAVVGALEIWMLVRRRYAPVAVIAPIAIMLVLYAPWLAAIRTAVGMVAQQRPPAVTPNPALEQGIRLAYLATSFTMGETPPVWAPIAGLLIAAPLLTFLWRAGRPYWLPVLLIAAGIGYVGAARWVSFAFVPARLLFLLPFYFILLSRRIWLCATLGVLYVISLYGYYHEQNFLNKGYLLPFDRIADIIEQRSGGRPAQLVVDIPGLDVSPLKRRLTIRVDSRPGVEVTWRLSNATPIEQPVWSESFVPYSDLDHATMRLLGWPQQPNYVLTLRQYLVQ